MKAIIWREIRLHYSKVYWLISNFTPPFFYLLFFGFIFSTVFQKVKFEGRDINYLHFFVPGLIAMQSFMTISYALSLVNLDRRVKIIDMIHTTATSFAEYFSGRVVSAQALALIKAAFLWTAAVAFFHLRPASMINLALAMITFAVSTFIWFCAGFTLGLLIRTEDLRDIVMQLLIMPLTFLSNIYYPVMNVPGIMKYAIAVNPLTHAVNLIRPALLGSQIPLIAGTIFVSAVSLAGYATVIGGFALIMVNRWSAKNQ